MPPPLLIDRVRAMHPMDARVTVTLFVVSVVLSVMRFLGADLLFLVTRPEGWPGNAWTLLTACLLHGGAWHLIPTSLATLVLGIRAESLIGSAGMLLLVIFTGAASMGMEWAFNGPAVGLSGIAYGIFGLLWALDRWHPWGRGLMDPGTTRMIVGWFFFCILLTVGGGVPIANIAHGVGGVLGVLLGWSLAHSPDQRGWRWFVFPVVSTVCVLVPLLATPKPVRLERALVQFNQGVHLLQQRGELNPVTEGGRAKELAAEAEQRFRSSLDSYSLPEAYWNLALCLEYQGRSQEASEPRARALELDPKLQERVRQQREEAGE